MTKLWNSLAGGIQQASSLPVFRIYSELINIQDLDVVLNTNIQKKTKIYNFKHLELLR